MPESFQSQDAVVGSTIDFTLYAKKDGAVWDITGGTVTLYLSDPSGNVSSFSATIDDGDAGLASYQVGTGVLDEEGDWQRQWKVTVSTTSIKSEAITFSVLPSLE